MNTGNTSSLKNSPSEYGAFIVFEGGEGAGKSTQIRFAKDYLVQRGLEVVVTFEPGATALGDQIRSLLLDKTFSNMHPRTETLLYAASRAEHVDKVIRPALARGAVVLCDRYWDASRAYQGVGRQLGIASIDMINGWATSGLLPSKVFVFDLCPRTGLERATKRGQGELDRVESESMTFHENVREAYKHLATVDPFRYEIIDATLDIEKIRILIQQSLKDLL